MADETLDSWLDQEIQYAENAVGMNRSYRQPYEVENARLQALKDVRAKMTELWGTALKAGNRADG